jgi:AraC-like DNA-binding protein
MRAEEVFSAYEHAAKTLKYVQVTDRTDYSITTVLIDSKDGIGTMRLYALFPGIFLGFNDFSSNSCPSYNGEIAEGLKINFCIDGRCEVKMVDGKYLFLEAGDLSIGIRTTEDAFSFPYDRFYGLELVIHTSALEQAPPPLFQDVGIDMNYICKKFCSESKSFVAQAGEKIKSVFLDIAEPPHECELDYFRIKVTELLFLLMHIEKPAENKRGSFFTMGQVKIARQVMEIITADLSEHHSINKLAKDFGISPTSLKKYFKGVYGQSISVYLRNKRMNKAAKYLEKSHRQIADIATLIGYENASKFSAAFRVAKGESPLEYRRKYRGSRTVLKKTDNKKE